tara:strand:+ start:16502 stop:17473 length:972 start_codon:yes stop_codon:yes gene_type:complete
LKKLRYWNRIIRAYIFEGNSQLSFWHEKPEASKGFKIESLGSYYMTFHKKADFISCADDNEIPMLDYKGSIGKQYNPIAIAQWGLGNYNIWLSTKSKKNYTKFIKSADWLCENLAKNDNNIKVWMHKFNFEYRDTLKKPWYSGLAQGQGLSLLLRALKETKNIKYEKSIADVYKSFQFDINEGGVICIDKFGNKWIEEYIVFPPTHILNGFIWSLWGIYDYYLYYNDPNAKKMFKEFSETIEKNLKHYDLGYWSKYELSNKPISMISSHFYHKLHITQLKIMYEITGKGIYNEFHKKWLIQEQNSLYRFVSLIHKSIFKVLFY